MSKLTNKEMLLDATMRIVAQGGLTSFSMRQVTRAVGVSEALIYRHYETKENLLFQCFLYVDRQIADLFRDETFYIKASDDEEFYEYIYGIWSRYFEFLIGNDYKTLYYFEYLDSPYIALVRKNNDLASRTNFKEFCSICGKINQNYRIFDKISVDSFWAYILDVSGVFAKRVIRRQIPGSAQSRKDMWRLMCWGLYGLLQGDVYDK